MLISYNSLPFQAALGQYVTLIKRFSSDTILTGEVLKFSPSISDSHLYIDDEPTNYLFQILYPPAAGIYDFTNLGAKNYKAKLKVIDQSNFEIHYSFFVTGPSNLNSNAFKTSSYYGAIIFNVKIDTDYISSPYDIDVSAFYDNQIEFIESGFIPNEDLIINFSLTGTTNNNIYVGLIKEDAISNSVSIVPGLITNYGLITFGSTQVDDIPINCLIDGFGFQENSGESLAGVKISGACLTANSSYKVYVVYFQDGNWKSCISGSITQTATNAPIIPVGTYSSSDSFGNIGENCLRGLSNDVALDLSYTLDVGDFNTQLTSKGLSGTFNDYFVAAKAFETNDASNFTGKSVILTNNNPTFEISGYKPTTVGQKYIIIQLQFDYPTHSDYVNVVFDLNYNAVEVPINVTVNGGVGELCDGETYTIDQTIDLDCELFQSVNGSTWVPNSIITGQNINVGAIPNYGVACFKLVCGDGADGPQDCECPECDEVTATIELLSDNNGIYINVTSDSDAINTLVEGSLFNPTGTVINSTLPYSLESLGLCQSGLIDKIYLEKPNGCKYEWQGYEEIIQGCVIPINSQVIIKNVVLSKLTINQDCDCPEPPIPCNNYAGINYDCNPETGEVSISVIENINSPIDSQELLCSTDGGLTFIPCPSTIIGEQNIFVTYDVSFTDGCDPIHIEQVIQCKILAQCQNNRTLEITNNSNTLEVNITDIFESTVLSDKLFVSTDNGANYTEYNPPSSYTPISLSGNEKIIVYTNTIFNDGCADLTVTKKLNLSQINDTECAGYNGYSLAASYDENTGEFTVTKTGNENDLTISQLLWTLGGSNPFDVNNSGMPYSGVVKGDGLFIARWKIKLPNCTEIILDAMAWGKSCIKICDPIEITSLNPPQITLISCCDGCPDMSFAITCNDRTLTLTGFNTGSTITWTGPNGFTGSGSVVQFPVGTPSGVFVATIQDGDCTYTANYNYTAPNAGQPILNPILV